MYGGAQRYNHTFTCMCTYSSPFAFILLYTLVQKLGSKVLWWIDRPGGHLPRELGAASAYKKLNVWMLPRIPKPRFPKSRINARILHSGTLDARSHAL